MIDIREHGGAFGGVGNNIKGIQRGEFILENNLLSGNVPIQQVDISSSIIRINSSMYETYSGTRYVSTVLVSGEFIDNKTLAFNKKFTLSSSDGDTVVSWEVIEFNNVKNIQRGKVASGLSPREVIVVPIESVDLNKSLIFISYTINNSSDMELSPRFRFEDNSNIRFFCPSARTEINYQVIQFK